MFKPKEQIGVGTVRISEQEKKYVNQVLDSNRLSYGPFSKKFEQEFAKSHGCKYCVLTNSGTSSLQVAVEALKEKYKWEDGDEILCPGVTFVATSNVIMQCNLTPVFVNVEKDTYNLDPNEIEKHITPKTKCMMVVHLYGQPANMDAILAIAKKHNLRVIEDSAETMFSNYKGKPVGSFGDIACFSTYACHIMVTGVGGLTTTNDPELAVILRSLVNHGRDNIYISMDDDKGKTGEELKEVISGRFKFVRMGYSYRITEMEAAIGVGQLESAPKNMEIRRNVATKLLTGMKKWEKFIQLPHKKEDRDHAYMTFPMIIKEDAPFTREELTFFLEEHMIETRQMVSLLDQPFYHEVFGKDIEDKYPVAKWIDHNGFYIGCHPEMTEEIITYILAMFDTFLEKYS